MSIAENVREIIKRFEDQEFRVAHVYVVIIRIPGYRDSAKLYTTVATCVRRMAKAGKLDIVSKWDQGKANIYRNIKQ